MANYVDITEPLDPLIAEWLRKMTPDERLAQALKLHRWGRRMTESGVRGQYPHWTDEQVQAEVLRRMLGGAGRTIALRGDGA